MKRVSVICEEKTEYTLDIVNEVYLPRGVDVYWRHELGIGDILRIYARHDIVVSNGYTGVDYWFGFIVNALFFKRIVGIDTDSQPEMPKGRFRRFCKRAALSWLYRKPWCWGLSGGTGIHRSAFAMYNMPEERIVLNPMVSRKKTQVDSNNDVGRFRFGYVGRLVPHKRVQRILDAWRKAHLVDTEFVVIGDGSERRGLEKSYPEVCFMGRLEGDELAREISSLNCLVLWSEYEPWGLVVNEALGFGIPVIVSDRVGAREDLIEGKGTGVVVPYDDILVLQNAMMEMVGKAGSMRDNCLGVANAWNMDFYAQCWDEWIQKIA